MSKPKTTTTTTDQLADDVLFGAEAIAAELGISIRKAFYLLEVQASACDQGWPHMDFDALAAAAVLRW